MNDKERNVFPVLPIVVSRQKGEYDATDGCPFVGANYFRSGYVNQKFSSLVTSSFSRYTFSIVT